MAPLACMRPQEPNLCSRVSNTLTIACPPLSPRLLLNLSTVTLALDFFLHLPLYLVLNRSPFVQHQRISWVLLNLPLLRLLGTSPLVLILPHTAVFIIPVPRQQAPGQTKCQIPEESIWQRTRTGRRLWQRVHGLRCARSESTASRGVLKCPAGGN